MNRLYLSWLGGVIVFLASGLSWSQEPTFQSRVEQKIMKQIAKLYSIADLQQLRNKREWNRLGILHIPNHELSFGKRFYENMESVDEQAVYKLMDASLDIKFYVWKDIQTGDDLHEHIKLKWVWSDSARFEQSIFANLCHEKCLPSFFSLHFFLSNHESYTHIKVTSESSGKDQHAGLLKYDFDKQEHVPFTEEEIETLNVLLNHELNRRYSNIWDIDGIEPYREPQDWIGSDESPKVDPTQSLPQIQLSGNPQKTELLEFSAISSASPTLLNHPLERYDISKGGYWTVYTVFAHAYEMKEKIHSQHPNLFSFLSFAGIAEDDFENLDRD
ncbi:MAG: hypothetical protein R3A11_01055 [Bdellovibrionota bacterium]